MHTSNAGIYRIEDWLGSHQVAMVKTFILYISIFTGRTQHGSLAQPDQLCSYISMQFHFYFHHLQDVLD